MATKVEHIEKEVSKFKAAVSKMDQMRTSTEGDTNYKVLLLLLVLSKYEHGSSTNVHYYYKLKDELAELMKKYRKRKYKTEVRPDQPFVRLANSYFWKVYPTPSKADINIDKSLRKKYLNNKDFYGYFTPHIHNLFTKYPFIRLSIIEWLISEFWDEKFIAPISRDLKVTI